MKIAVIGAGSSYTPEILEGLLDRESFPDLHLALYDLPEGRERLAVIAALAGRMAGAKGIPVEIATPSTLEEALEGCRFVVSQFRTGLLEARIQDEKIPLRYGLIGQETTGAGGFFNAMRTIPKALELAREMERMCPDAWLINFTNPAGIVTEAVCSHSRVKAVGLCNVPYNMQVDCARILGVEPERVLCRMAGLNHLSFVTGVFLDGEPVLERMIRERRFDAQLVKNVPKMPGVAELVARLGLVPSPYLQYYYYEGAMLAKQQKELADGTGTRGEQVLRTQEELFRRYADPSLTEKPRELEARGGAYYSTVATSLMKALLGRASMNTPVNAVNRGAIPNLPACAVVEVSCLVDASGVQPLACEPLPPQVAGLVQQVKAYETLTVAAAVERSRQRAVQALLAHPLVHGYDNAEGLVRELEGQRQWGVELR